MRQATVPAMDIPLQDRFQVITEHSGYQRIPDPLKTNPGTRPQDVLINLLETAWENWSFGSGEAQSTE